MRLNRFLAAAGVASRRQCDELIKTGRVTVNGKLCIDFSLQPGERDHVKVDGKLVHVDLPVTIILHKPGGFVSTKSDPHARDTIFDLLPGKFPRLFSVGRLDAQSEGLLILTNDGELAQRLTHPRYKIDKEYEVTLDRHWDPALTSKLSRGIFLDGQRAQIARLHSITPTRLPRGHWRALTKRELKMLRTANPAQDVLRSFARQDQETRPTSARIRDAIRESRIASQPSKIVKLGNSVRRRPRAGAQ